MSRHPHVAAVPGSLRDDSVTRVAAEQALAAADRAGATTDLVDLRAVDLPVFDADRPDAGDAPAVRRCVRDADAVLLATPVYHHSYASPLKTVLDYCGFDEFEDTVVGVLAVSGGGAGGAPSEALAHLRGVVTGLRAWLHPRQVVVPNGSDKVADGALDDPDIAARVDELGEKLARAATADAPEVAATAD